MKAVIKFILQVVYNVGFMTFFFITGPYFLFTLWRRGKLLPQFGQRFGFYSKEVRERLAPGADLWIHAVSVGEVKLARVLIRCLRELRPDLRVVVSSTTGTGFTLAKKRLEDAQTSVIYNPIDFLWSVVHAFKLIRPKRLVLIESEIWPNYLWCAKRRHIPIYLVNTRLSDRTEERYRRLRRLVRPVLQDIDLVFAQDATEVLRLTQAGFAPEAIFDLGCLKYDVAELEALDAVDVTKEKEISEWWDRTGWGSAHSILLGGSTHPGEEEVLARIYRELREEWPQLRLVLAPRHAERGAAIRDMCDRMGLRAVTRTQLAESTVPLRNGSTPEVLVVNSTGELGSLYKRATLAFVGKSLRGQGGQNFIEAAPVGLPIVIGPNMQNFKVITREFINQQAVVQVTDEFELANCLHALFSSDEIRRELGKRAKATFEANLGAAKRTAEVIVRSLASPKKEEAATPSSSSQSRGTPMNSPRQEIKVRFSASKLKTELSKDNVLVFGLSSKDHYLTIQRNVGRKPDKSGFGDIHFECDGQGWGGYDVIKSIELVAGVLRISLIPERAEDFDGRFEYEIVLALDSIEDEAATTFLERMFKGTDLLKHSLKTKDNRDSNT